MVTHVSSRLQTIAGEQMGNTYCVHISLFIDGWQSFPKALRV